MDRELGHTSKWILTQLRAVMATPEDLVKLKYRKSVQPDKKAVTMLRHLKKLQTLGLVELVEPKRWRLTPKGKEYATLI